MTLGYDETIDVVHRWLGTEITILFSSNMPFFEPRTCEGRLERWSLPAPGTPIISGRSDAMNAADEEGERFSLIGDDVSLPAMSFGLFRTTFAGAEWIEDPARGRGLAIQQNRTFRLELFELAKQ